VLKTHVLYDKKCTSILFIYGIIYN